MSDRFDREFWERRWDQALSEHGDAIARKPPHPLLVEAAERLAPGRALDAGCGHGAEALWLAAAGWTVTAVDFSETALDQARCQAETLGLAERVEWLEADLGTWAPPPAAFDLVSCLYVHVAGPAEEMVRRLGAGVAPRGALLLVGHMPVDPASGAPTPAAGQTQVSVDAALAGLELVHWDVRVAEERPRAAAGTGVDAVIHAVRRG